MDERENMIASGASQAISAGEKESMQFMAEVGKRRKLRAGKVEGTGLRVGTELSLFIRRLGASSANSKSGPNCYIDVGTFDFAGTAR